MNLKTFCGDAAMVLRSSERMVLRNVDIWRETPETHGEQHDPDWHVSFSQAEVEGLIRNLTDAASLFDLLSKNPQAAADLLKAHSDGGAA